MVRTYFTLKSVEAVIRAVRFVLPWVFRVIFAVIGTILVSLLTFWRGVPGACNRTAFEWGQRAYRAGFPSELDTTLYWVSYVVTFITFVAAWVLLAYTTIWIINLII